jgi:acyl-coenzyme A thioesterase PaaI-like protein
VALGSVLKAGKRFHFCEAEIFSVHQGVYTLMAKASSTMAVIALKD